jgi:CBS-domain-containing membrane protein
MPRPSTAVAWLRARALRLSGGTAGRPSQLAGSPLARALKPLLPHARLGAGVFISAILVAAAGAATGTPLLIAPFLATAALKHTAPHLPGVAPHRVVGGHLIGALAGIAVGAVLGEGTIAIAIAAASAAVLMMGLDVLHSPGVATAYIAVQNHGDHWFPLSVVLVGAAALVATTMVLSPLLHGQRYPARAA